MSVHRYPTAALVADYGRAGVGFALTAGPLALADPAPVFFWCLAGLAAIFAAFAGRTALRQLTRYELAPDALAAVGPLPRRIAWDQLQDLRLRYFSTKRDRKEGWLQLDLKAANGRIRLDSTLDDFHLVVRRAAEAAASRGLSLGETTRGNLVGLGVRPPDPAPRRPEDVAMRTAEAR